MKSLLALSLVFTLVSAASGAEWRELAPGVWRQDSIPAAYVVVDGAEAVGFGAPAELDLASLEAKLATKVGTVLLTHSHRDTTAAAERLLAEKRIVRASKLSEPWLSPAGVEKYWNDSVVTPIADPPLRHRRWAVWQYFVPARGVEGVRFDLADGDVLRCGKWSVTAFKAAGHSPDHTAYLAQHDDRPGRAVFCGDAFSHAGKLHAPFTTEWHHQQPDGLSAAAESLRRIAAIEPSLLCPEHGEPVTDGIDAALARTAQAVRRAAVAKGYDTYLEASGRTPPEPKFLADIHVGGANADGNSLDFTKLSPHLYLCGNTYAIASRDGPCLLVDPYHRRLQDEIAWLRRDHGVGPVEAMTISHAHNDHYTGVFYFARDKNPPVWALDRIADVVANPDHVRAPYVDPRPVKIARRLIDGEEVAWREYRLKFHHLPGQTEFAMGLELKIDGRKVLFTGDNFYRHDQYSGSGGWSGHNRGLPAGYIRSLKKIIEMKPDWILAEHGGAMEYSAEDFATRLAWAKEAAAAADELSESTDHTRDWNPHRVSIAPAIIRAKANDIVAAVISVDANEGANSKLGSIERDGSLTIRPAENKVLGTKQFDAVRDQRKIGFRILPDAPPGRHVIPFDVLLGGVPLAVDCVIVVEVAGENEKK